MKKIVAAFATSIMIAGTAVSSVSAEEYEVIKGDSLWDIANEFNTTIDDLIEINKLQETVIHPKQKLLVSETYEVVKGDTLSEIGQEFNVPVRDLMEWNGLESDLIIIGQELEIKGANIMNGKQPKSVVTESSGMDKPAKTEKKEQAVTTSKKVESKSNDAPEGKTITVTATAYTAECDGCTGITATGVDLNANRNAKVIAVDPNVIPLGTKVYVEGYGYATAEDVGGAIKGNKIDIHVPTKEEAYKWGVRTVNVTIIN